MKFLKWIFNVSSRHRGDIRRYEKGGIGNRIFVLFLMIGLVIGTLALQYWALNLLESDFLIAVLVIIFLFIPAAGVSIEYCGLYSFIGFSMAIVGTIEKVTITMAKEEIKEKQYKIFDLLIGIISLVLAFGLIVAIVYLFVNHA